MKAKFAPITKIKNYAKIVNVWADKSVHYTSQQRSVLVRTFFLRQWLSG